MGFESPIFAYFCVFWPYFRGNSVGKSYRNANINYLCESKTKIGENRRKMAKIGGFQVLPVQKLTRAGIKVYGPVSSDRKDRLFFAIIPKFRGIIKAKLSDLDWTNPLSSVGCQERSCPSPKGEGRTFPTPTSDRGSSGQGNLVFL